MKVSAPLSKFNIGDIVFVSVHLGGLEQKLEAYIVDVEFHDTLREFFYAVKFFQNEQFLKHYSKSDVDYRLGGLEEWIISKIEKEYE